MGPCTQGTLRGVPVHSAAFAGTHCAEAGHAELNWVVTYRDGLPSHIQLSIPLLKLEVVADFVVCLCKG